MKKETEEAIDYLYRVVKTSKETAYNLVYQDRDIKHIETLLDYIKALEREIKDCDMVIVSQNKEIKELKKEYIENEFLREMENMQRDMKEMQMRVDLLRNKAQKKED